MSSRPRSSRRRTTFWRSVRTRSRSWAVVQTDVAAERASGCARHGPRRLRERSGQRRTGLRRAGGIGRLTRVPRFPGTPRNAGTECRAGNGRAPDQERWSLHARRRDGRGPTWLSRNGPQRTTGSGRGRRGGPVRLVRRSDGRRRARRLGLVSFERHVDHLAPRASCRRSRRSSRAGRSSRARRRPTARTPSARRRSRRRGSYGHMLATVANSDHAVVRPPMIHDALMPPGTEYGRCTWPCDCTAA